MRVVIFGATGNLGTSCVTAFSADARVREIVGIARRAPRWTVPKTRFVTADVRRDELTRHVAGADVVVHLAWEIQPARDTRRLWETNVTGSQRVFRAAADAGVNALLYASSVGAYAPGFRRRVDESWPATGIPGSTYSEHKVAVEQLLDDVERSAPGLRVVRMRPALVFKREAATGIRRLFIGPVAPRFVFRNRGLIVPSILQLQCVHSLDVGEAFRLAAFSDCRGAFNLAAEPVIDRRVFAEQFSALSLPIPPAILKALTAVTWRMHLHRSDPGWMQLALNVPVLIAERAERELHWAPRHTAVEALKELLAGLRRGDGWPTPPLARKRAYGLLPRAQEARG
jgi:nucleoside-diphosphate-sugar epimerase